MLPDRVLNPGPLTYESGALPIALCGPALTKRNFLAPHFSLQKIFLKATMFFFVFFLNQIVQEN